MDVTEILNACRALEGAFSAAGFSRARARLKVNALPDQPYWIDLEWQKKGAEGWRTRHFATHDATMLPELFTRAGNWIASLPERERRGLDELRESLDLIIAAAPAAGISADTVVLLEKARSGMIPANSVAGRKGAP
jgi:hypothetical protein